MLAGLAALMRVRRPHLARELIECILRVRAYRVHKGVLHLTHDLIRYYTAGRLDGHYHGTERYTYNDRPAHVTEIQWYFSTCPRNARRKWLDGVPE